MRIIVEAGPGTGKTHTLVQRVIRLLHERPSPITVITFTNKAVEEVRQRLVGISAPKRSVRVDTFHGFCLRWLRQRNPDLCLVGSEMRNRLFSRLYSQLLSAERKKLQRDAASFLSIQPRLPDTFPESLQPFFSHLRQHNFMDLDEIIPACAALMRDDKLFAKELRAATGHLLVDEFQDLNASQYELVRLLAKTCSIFAIGDPDQAIYGFRGSTPAWFHRFIEKQQPERYSLTTNYRSGSNILQAAAMVISENHTRKTRRTTIAAGSKEGVIYRHQAVDAKAEARFIAEQVQQLIGGTSHREIDQLTEPSASGLALSDIAVLYRTGKQATLIAEALADRSIPCQVVGLKPFYQTGDAKILYYSVLAAAGVIDKAELLFLLGGEQGIGNQGISAIELLLPDNSKDSFADLVEKTALLPAPLQQRLIGFIEFFE